MHDADEPRIFRTLRSFLNGEEPDEANYFHFSATLRTDLDAIRVFALSKIGWIRQQRQKLRERERETPGEYLDRESHYVWGKRYLLE